MHPAQTGSWGELKEFIVSSFVRLGPAGGCDPGGVTRELCFAISSTDTM